MVKKRQNIYDGCINSLVRSYFGSYGHSVNYQIILYILSQIDRLFTLLIKARVRVVDFHKLWLWSWLVTDIKTTGTFCYVDDFSNENVSISRDCVILVVDVFFQRYPFVSVRRPLPFKISTCFRDLICYFLSYFLPTYFVVRPTDTMLRVSFLIHPVLLSNVGLINKYEWPILNIGHTSDLMGCSRFLLRSNQ